MGNKKNIAKNVAKGLAKVGTETAKEAPKSKKSKGKVDFQWENKKQGEIDQIKQAIKTASNGDESKDKPKKPKKGSLDLGGKPKAQDMEKQVEEVRKEKEKKEKKKEEDEGILKQLKKQREQEEQEARADANDILPSSNKPQRGSALQKRKKKGGTGELGKLKN